TRPFAASAQEEMESLEEIATPGHSSVEAVAEFLGVPAAKVMKTLLYNSDQGLVAVLVRGDREINEAKLASHLGAGFLELANEEQVREATGAPVGFAGPVGLKEKGVRIVADQSVRGMRNFVVGANRADAHLMGVNAERDVHLEEMADLLLVASGDPCPRCEEGTLQIYRGIEVGHIFQLGTKYSQPMGCTFLDQNGASQAMIMGCYGLGIGRTVAAAIEQNHDEHGIVWPLPLAPFSVLLSALNPDDEQVKETAEGLYRELSEAGVEVLYDDRDERPGVKFKDADLIGIPIRLVVGARSLANGQVELSRRRDRERQMVPVADASARVQGLLSEDV
ncbi:MAG TPA: proline--tRNA ligase, partial [Thermoanaerobaculia bacterium]|nr:proline--tRNA ligase [Thermoanaerobaculia bacterium]